MIKKEHEKIIKCPICRSPKLKLLGSYFRNIIGQPEISVRQFKCENQHNFEVENFENNTTEIKIKYVKGWHSKVGLGAIGTNLQWDRLENDGIEIKKLEKEVLSS